MYSLIFAVCAYLWPRQTVEWIVAVIVAVIGTVYMTIGHPHNTPLVSAGWAAGFYVVTMLIFGWLDWRPSNKVAASVANDN